MITPGPATANVCYKNKKTILYLKLYTNMPVINLKKRLNFLSTFRHFLASDNI